MKLIRRVLDLFIRVLPFLAVKVESIYDFYSYLNNQLGQWNQDQRYIDQWYRQGYFENPRFTYYYPPRDISKTETENEDSIINDSKLEDPNICTSVECQKTSKFFKNNKNPHVSICENFFEHACGKFGKDVNLDHYWGIYDIRDVINNSINEYVLELLKHDKDDDLEAVNQMKKFHSSCLNEGMIEKKGMSTLESALNDIGLPLILPIYKPIENTSSITVYLAKIHKFAHLAKFLFKWILKDEGYFYLKDIHFTFDADLSDINEEIYGSFDTGSIVSALKDWTYLEKSENILLEKDFMMDIIFHLYTEDINEYLWEHQETVKEDLKKRIEDVRTFLNDIRKIIKVEIEGKRDKFITLEELQTSTNSILEKSEIKIDWLMYFEIIFEGHKLELDIFVKETKDINVYIKNYTFFHEILILLSNTSETTLVRTMWYVIIHSVSKMSTSYIRNAKRSFDSEVIPHFVPHSRNADCMRFTKTIFGYAVTYKLMQRDNFTSRHKMVYK